MYSSTLFTLAAAAAAVQAVNLKRDVLTVTGDGLEEYFYRTCYPVTNTTKTAHSYVAQPDFNYPCNIAAYIQETCTDGKAPSFDPNDDDSYGYYSSAQGEASPRDQQICFCQSQWFDQVQGCLNCIQKHGFDKIPELDQSLPPTFTLSAFSSSICQATVTPTAAFLEYFINATDPNISSSIDPMNSPLPKGYSTSKITFTDPIGNKTDVSLYFTPSVTGAAVTQVSAGVPTLSSTPSGRGHLFSHSSSLASSTPTSSASPLSLNTNSAGQIVATAGPAASSAAAAKSSSSKGAAPTAVADKVAYAGAGLLGLAAVVAAL